MIKRYLACILVFCFSQQTILANGIIEFKLESLKVKSVFRILHEKSNPYLSDEIEWINFGVDTSYAKKDTIELTNNKFFYPDSSTCYYSKWKFVNTKKNEINITRNVFLCKEPPSGGVTTFNIIQVNKENTNLYIIILDSNLKVIDKFQIINIESTLEKENGIPYKITLLRI